MPDLTRAQMSAPATSTSQDTSHAASASTSETVRAQVDQTRRAAETLSQAASSAASSRRDEVDRVFTGLRALADEESQGPSTRKDEASRLLDELAAGERSDADAARRLTEQVATVLASTASVLAPEQSGQGARQGADLARLTEQAVAALDVRGRDLRNRQAVEQSQVAATIAGGSLDRLGETLRTQESARDAQARADARLLDFMAARAQDIANPLGAERVAALREALGPVGADLDDAALERIANDARRLQDGIGEDVGGKDMDGAVLRSAISGSLAEELNDRRQEMALQARGDPASTYVASHRITDGFGKQLTDGLVVSRSGTHDEITEAFEVKAGAASARDLTFRLQRDRSDELANYARDLAPDPSDPAQRDRMKEELSTRSVQREAGQLAATQERLAQQRVFVDGVELRLRDDDRRRVQVRPVLPSDVRPRAEAVRLQHSQDELRRAAAAAAELVRRWAEEP